MTLKQFAQQIREDYPNTKRVYIAIIPSGKNYMLEMEVIPEVEIGGAYLANDKLSSVRKKADQLDAELTNLGFIVCKTREEWESEQTLELDDSEI